MADISASQKCACAQREVAMRKRVYPKWIAEGKMTAEQAHREIETMQAIADDYQKMSSPYERTLL